MAIDPNSSIYVCKVVHNRVQPKKNFFQYNIFTFCLDLDEVEALDKQLLGFGFNRFSLFSFYTKDHMDFGKPTPKENILHYLETMEFPTSSVGKVFLLSNLRVIGYVFNPVSFYWIFDKAENPIACLVEVGNTFGEQKPFLLLPSLPDSSTQKTFSQKESESRIGSDPFPFDEEMKKLFYVSPFIQLESQFHFRIGLPEESLKIQIHSYRPETKTGNPVSGGNGGDEISSEKSSVGKGILFTNYFGTRKKLNSKNLIFYFFRYPLVTVKIIGAIHLQALKLFLMGLPFLKKNQDLDKQIGVHFGGKTTHNPTI